MANGTTVSGIAAGRLSAEAYAENFRDLHPPLDRHQAAIEAARCYFCHDAPCVEACPTGIDIPMFIRQISTGNLDGSARTIYAENIMGGMCARVCPTETLCEEACVRSGAEDKPVAIGLLQRHATDAYMESGRHPVAAAEPTGKHVAVVGAGPAGLACAHRLASLGHEVTVYEAREKSGGLNEFGIAAYKSTDDFAAREVNFIRAIGGIDVKHGVALGSNLTLDALRAGHDAVFLGLGLGGANDLGIPGEDQDGVYSAIDYIPQLRQARDLSALPVGRNVVVIGGGMTAIDIAVQMRLLGAENVTLAYRRGPEQMSASGMEQNLAQTHGVRLMHWVRPVEIKSGAIGLQRTELDASGKLVDGDEAFELEADMVFKAIGQTFLEQALAGGQAPELTGGRIAAGADRKSSLPDVWAGGDCIAGGEDLTVAAVEDGKVAAHSIDSFLKSGGEK